MVNPIIDVQVFNLASKLGLEKEDLNNVGVVFGVGIGGIKTFEDEVKYYGTHEENGPKFNPLFIPKMIADIASGQISIHFGFHGPNYTTPPLTMMFALPKRIRLKASANALLEEAHADVVV